MRRSGRACFLGWRAPHQQALRGVGGRAVHVRASLRCRRGGSRRIGRQCAWTSAGQPLPGEYPLERKAGCGPGTCRHRQFRPHVEKVPIKSVSEVAARRIALTVAAGFFMETLDATIIVTALPAIAGALGVPTLDASLTVTVYLIAMAVFVPAAGWCAERFGARRVFVAALGAFTLASLLCGAARSIEWLVAARLLQGSAAAFMSPVGRLVVLRETPKHRIIE